MEGSEARRVHRMGGQAGASVAETGRGPELVPVEELEEAVTTVPGVLRCRILVTDAGAIDEVHVVATTERSPKTIVRDVETLLAGRYGLRVDYRRISVAQVTDPVHTLPALRFVIHSQHVATDRPRNRAEVTVTLGVSDEPEARYVGRAAGLPVRRQVMRTAAEATLQAVSQALRGDVTFTVDEVTSVEMGVGTVYVCALSLLWSRGREDVVVGAALDRGDMLLAVVRATLDAVNRRVAHLPLRRGSPEPVEEGVQDA